MLAILLIIESLAMLGILLILESLGWRTDSTPTNSTRG